MSLTKRIQCLFLVLTMTAHFGLAAPVETQTRIKNAVDVLNRLANSSGHGISAEQLANADCVAVIPGFTKGAAVVGIGFGRGFISCRNGDKWSAPGAVTLESGSLGVQAGGEKINIVVLSLDKNLRSKLLSSRFTIGADASASWGNGKSARNDPNAKLLFFGQSGGIFAGFGLDGATLKTDDSGDKALYGKPMANSEIIGGQIEPPAVATPLLEDLNRLASR
jgi:lipid-binding SYLF domain-containing protein